jgi:hypothetical protein
MQEPSKVLVIAATAEGPHGAPDLHDDTRAGLSAAQGRERGQSIVTVQSEQIINGEWRRALILGHVPVDGEGHRASVQGHVRTIGARLLTQAPPLLVNHDLPASWFDGHRSDQARRPSWRNQSRAAPARQAPGDVCQVHEQAREPSTARPTSPAERGPLARASTTPLLPGGVKRGRANARKLLRQAMPRPMSESRQSKCV